VGQPPVSSRHVDGRRPFVVAHRAGNRLAALDAVQRSGLALAEADVRLFRGRLEVRHLKSVGPLPILWDRWTMSAPWRPRLLLRELLAESAEQAELVLDLKGRRLRLAELVLEALQPYLASRRFTVCARDWRLLEPFAELPVRSVHSVGSTRQLRRFLRERGGGRRVDGVSIHERLLDGGTVALLRAAADEIMTWPVNRPERARELLRLGVDGLITDDLAAISGLGAFGPSR
jgi:glycerophosphoryl diester phosphodiesterase